MEDLKHQNGAWEGSHVENRDPEKSDDVDPRISIIQGGEIINASGHPDQLKRHYGLLSICGLALTIDNAWVALGGSIAVSISPSPIMYDQVPVLSALQIMGDRLVCSMSFWLHASTMLSSLHLLPRYVCPRCLRS